MPRPKRARRAPAAPAVPVVAAPEDKSSPAPGSGSDIYSHSDREHSVIRKELEQAGANTRTRRSASVRQKQAPEEAGQAEEESPDRPEEEQNKKSSSKEKLSGEQQKSDSSVEAGRKTRATPVRQRRDTSGLDIDDDLFNLDTTIGDDDDDNDEAVPPSAARSDTSTFSVSHFRRRGRAPSISINRDDGPIRPSSRGITTPGISSTFNIGQFKRRNREPSILGTAQKERAQRPLEPSSEPEAGDDDEDDDVEDFVPEAESTPLNNRRRTQTVPAAEPDSETEGVTESQQILAPDSQPEIEAERTASAKSRKRKSVESHEDTDRPGKTSRTDPELVDDDSDDSDSSSLSDLRTPELTPTRTTQRPVTPDQDEIMAPPESSGSEDGDQAWPDIRTLAKQRRRHQSPTTPTRDGNESNVSSPPSLTHSPNFPATRNKPKPKPKKQQKKITTAELTSMLPQRRHKKPRDQLDVEESAEEEVEASDTSENDDELSYVGTRSRPRRPKTTPLNRSSANRPPSRGGKTAPSTAKSKETSRGARLSTRTYSRRLSDKENQGEGEDEAGAEDSRLVPDEDEATEGQESNDPLRSADELKKAVRKFNEVDRWELEFEEVTEGSSPNRDGR
ncbi:hypothetical protein CMUS01_03087 [Colletotrichum musicola]|uniref:Uncharacterized protein n=1 Tax=Colletotrichum musicola TaxID=2175873 RepID=A0A8H6U6H7_9PEZI|nr:hypothetical protein CMUS01_03087 [Colletotrichum musicola]